MEQINIQDSNVDKEDNTKFSILTQHIKSYMAKIYLLSMSINYIAYFYAAYVVREVQGYDVVILSKPGEVQIIISILLILFILVISVLSMISITKIYNSYKFNASLINKKQKLLINHCQIYTILYILILWWMTFNTLNMDCSGAFNFTCPAAFLSTVILHTGWFAINLFILRAYTK